MIDGDDYAKEAKRSITVEAESREPIVILNMMSIFSCIQSV